MALKSMKWVAFAGLLASGAASATNVAVVTTGASAGCCGYGFGNSNWSGFTGDVNSAAAGSGGSVSIVSSISASILSYDALIVDQRWTGASLPAAELTNLSSFIASGKRVLLVGENDSWTAWNNDLLSTVGGHYSGVTYNGSATPVVANSLTSGVGSIYLAAAGVAEGGTALFSQNFATLWGAQQSVLSVLDINVFDNAYGNSTFKTNVATWLVAPSVPEPSAYAMVFGGLLAVGVLARRRRAD